MFSEQESLVMIMTVVPEEKVEPMLAGLRPLFERYSGVMFVSDVTVSRREYFGEEGAQVLSPPSRTPLLSELARRWAEPCLCSTDCLQCARLDL